jgi:hypothetical protein
MSPSRADYWKQTPLARFRGRVANGSDELR